MKVSESVKIQHFQLWYELFKSSQGRFLSDPMKFRKSVMVHYEIPEEDEMTLSAEFLRLTTPITETRRSWLRRILIKLKRILPVI